MGKVLYGLLDFWEFCQQCERGCCEVEEELGAEAVERFKFEDSKVIPFNVTFS